MMVCGCIVSNDALAGALLGLNCTPVTTTVSSSEPPQACVSSLDATVVVSSAEAGLEAAMSAPRIATALTAVVASDSAKAELEIRNIFRRRNVSMAQYPSVGGEDATG